MKINEIFDIEHYSEACKLLQTLGDDKYTIEEVEPSADNKRQFRIVEYSSEPTEEQKLELLRQRRESECFEVINRGRLWYDKLTDLQLADLREWYNEWLDVTETRVIPQKPLWLELEGE